MLVDKYKKLLLFMCVCVSLLLLLLLLDEEAIAMPGLFSLLLFPIIFTKITNRCIYFYGNWPFSDVLILESCGGGGDDGFIGII